MEQKTCTSMYSKNKNPFFNIKLTFLSWLLSVSFLSCTSAYAAIFSGEVVPVAAPGITSIVLTDLNKDGSLDLVSTSENNNLLSVSLGDGKGSFLTPVDFTTGSLPQELRIVDVNNDTNLDAVVVNQGTGTVSVLLGDGSGSLGTKTDFSVGSIPTSIAVGDLNKDGNVDIIVTNVTTDTLSLLLGDGTGNFAAAVTITAGDGPTSVEISDVNNDTNLDVVVANRDGGDVMIFSGDGTGGLALPVSLSVGINLKNIILADLNGNGLDDILLTKSFASGFSVLLATGGGNYGLPSNYNAFSTVGSLSVDDINDDGFQDVVIASSSGISLLSGDGSGLLNPSTELFDAASSFITTGNINQDGVIDILFATSDGLVSMIGKGVGVFTEQLTGITQPQIVIQGDFNSDGNLDVISANVIASSSSYVFLGDNAGDLSLFDIHSFPDLISSIIANDVNRDGVLDLIGVGKFQNQVFYSIGNGDGSFTNTSNFLVGTSPEQVTSGDVNSDANPDLIVTNTADNTVTILLGNGRGGFTDGGAFATGTLPTKLVLVDFNEDGDLDVITTNSGGNSISILLGSPTGALSAPSNIGVGSFPGAIVAADFNKDGHIDLATANTNSQNITILIGDGTGGIASTQLISISTSPSSLYGSDINADGNIDLIAADGTNGSVILFTGDGAGNFNTAINYFVGGNTTAFIAADINKDARLDLVVAEKDGNKLVLLKNIESRPGAANDSVSTLQNTTVITPDVLLNDIDNEATGSISLNGVDANSIQGGAVVNNLDNTFDYSPAIGFLGQDSFNYNIIDGDGNTATAKVLVDVKLTNQPPILTTSDIVTNEDTQGDTQISVFDPDLGDTFTFNITSAASNGFVAVDANGLVSYIPSLDFNGADSLTVTVTDNNAGSSAVTINITVQAVNDPPAATAPDIITNEDVTGTSQVIVTDPDAGDSFTYSISVAPANGFASVDNNGFVSFSPTANFSGVDFISVRVADLAGAFGFVTINVTVNPTNDPPFPTAPDIIILEDTSGNSQIQPNDPDVGDTATYVLKTQASSGTASVNATGQVSYTPNTDFNGTDSVIVTVTDALGLFADVSVSITVTNVNDPPVPTASVIATNEDTVGSGQILPNDPDPDDSFQYTLATLPANGIVSIASDGQMSYVPNANYFGSDSFAVNVTDSEDESASVTVDVNVLPLNDPPSISAQIINTTEEQSSTTQVVVTDPDAGDTFSFAIVTQPNLGSAEVDSNGLVTYTPAAQFSGSEFFTVQVNDSGGASVLITIGATVSGVNDAPTATAANISTISGGTATTLIIVNDPDNGDTFTYAISTPPEHGDASVSVNGLVNFTADSDFSGSDAITITITDSAGANGTIAIGIQINSVPTTAPAPTPAPVINTSGGGSINFWFIASLLLIFGIRMRRIKGI